MDAVTLLRNHIDVERLMKHYDFDKMKHHGKIIRACCKIHGGDNPTAFVMNTENGLWYCHTGDCGAGDVFTLVQKMENLDFPSAVKWVANFFHVDISNLQITERKQAYMQEIKQWIKTMQSRKKKTLNEYVIDAEIREVTKFREFKEETLRHFDLGYVERIKLKKRDGGEYTLYNRLVFPIIQNGIQVGALFRRIKSTDVPKWSNQPANIETENLLYNYDATHGKMEIVVVEGILDVWAYHEIGITAVATFGAHLTEEQAKLLLRTGADIVLSYDGDDAGRIATKKAIDMLKYKANIKCVVFDEGEDPENIGREELKKRYEHKRRV